MAKKDMDTLYAIAKRFLMYHNQNSVLKHRHDAEGHSDSCIIEAYVNALALAWCHRKTIPNPSQLRFEGI